MIEGKDAPLLNQAAVLRIEARDGRKKPPELIYFVSCSRSFTAACPLHPRAMNRCGTEQAAITAWNSRVSAPIVAPEVDAAQLIPNNWCDPLLTGPNAALGKPPYGCPDVERLLNALRERLTSAPASPAALRDEAAYDDWVAWLRYDYTNEETTGTTIHVCDSDAKGAFKVYRAPVNPTPAPSTLAKAAETCVNCHHLKLNPWSGFCKHETSPFGKRPVTYCGCKCEFPAPVVISLLARRITEELKSCGFLDCDLFVKASDARMDQIAAIIERCLSGGGEDQKSTPTGLSGSPR